MTSSLTQTTSTNSSRGSSGVYLYVSRIDSVIEPSQLTLECKTSSDDVVFWRQVEGQAERLTVCLLELKCVFVYVFMCLSISDMRTPD